MWLFRVGLFWGGGCRHRWPAIPLLPISPQSPTLSHSTMPPQSPNPSKVGIRSQFHPQYVGGASAVSANNLAEKWFPTISHCVSIVYDCIHGLHSGDYATLCALGRACGRLGAVQSDRLDRRRPPHRKVYRTPQANRRGGPTVSRTSYISTFSLASPPLCFAVTTPPVFERVVPRKI